VWEQLYVEEMEVLCKNLLSHLELRLYLCPLIGEHWYLHINKSIKRFMMGARGTQSCCSNVAHKWLPNAFLHPLRFQFTIIGCEYDFGITEKNEILHTLDLLGWDRVKRG
jgi:hypothetical protein